MKWVHWSVAAVAAVGLAIAVATVSGTGEPTVGELGDADHGAAASDSQKRVAFAQVAGGEPTRVPIWLGTNLDIHAPWGGYHLFANLARRADGWHIASGVDALQVDPESGLPFGLPNGAKIALQPGLSGYIPDEIHVVHFEGQHVDVGPGNPNQVVSRSVNTFSYRVTPDKPHSSTVYVRAIADGAELTALTIRRKSQLDSPGVYNPVLVSILRHYRGVRVMGLVETNRDDAVNFTSVTPEYLEQRIPAPEHLVGIANEADIALWINVPVRYDDVAVATLAQRLAAAGPKGVLYVELGNEIWNQASPFSAATLYVEHMDAPVHTVSAVDDEENAFVLADHGLQNGDMLVGALPRTAIPRAPWQLRTHLVRVMDVTRDSFRVGDWQARSSLSFDLLNVDRWQFRRVDEANVGINRNYARRAQRVFEIFHEAFGDTARIEYVIAGQHAANAMHSERLEAIGAATAYATAPYFNGPDKAWLLRHQPWGRREDGDTQGDQGAQGGREGRRMSAAEFVSAALHPSQSAGNAGVIAKVAKLRGLTDAAGVRLLAYEAGSHVTNPFATNDPSHLPYARYLAELERSIAFAEFEAGWVRMLVEAGMAEVWHFTAISLPRRSTFFGVMHDESDARSARYRALQQLVGSAGPKALD